MSDPYPSEKVDLEADHIDELPKGIRFDNIEDSPRSKSQDHALARTASISSQNIVAYRTLSITVSEHNGKRVTNRTPKRGLWGQKKDAVQGASENRSSFSTRCISIDTFLIQRLHSQTFTSKMWMSYSSNSLLLKLWA